MPTPGLEVILLSSGLGSTSHFIEHANYCTDSFDKLLSFGNVNFVLLGEFRLGKMLQNY